MSDEIAAGVLVVGAGAAGSACAEALREGSGFVPNADTVVEAGDEVLVVLDPGLEDAITERFVGRDGRG